MENQSKHTFKETLSALLRSNRRHGRFVQALFILAVLVAVVVPLSMRQSGVAMTTTETHLKCSYAGDGAHTHNADCYDAYGNLVCPLPEKPFHTHTADCYATETVLACGQAETEGHTHDEACYDEDGNLTCTLAEVPAHTHTDACYETRATDQLICGLEETTEEHVHGPACFETVTVNLPDPEPEAAADPEVSVAPAAEEDPTPAQELTGTLKAKDENGNEYVYLVVRVEAPQGALPKGSTMSLAHVDLNKKDDLTGLTGQQKLDEALRKEAGDAAAITQADAVDITFKDAEGNRVDPAKKVEVRITTSMIRTFSDQRTAGDEAVANNSLMVLHVVDHQHTKRADAPNAELVRDVALTNQDENDHSTGHEDTIVFEATEFSSYVVARVDGAANAPVAEAQSEPEAQPAETTDQPLVEATIDLTATEDEPEPEQPATPKAPAQTFSHRFSTTSGQDLLVVNVSAPDGAFPLGTTMQVAWVNASQVERAVTKAVSERTDGRLRDLRAVDITFIDSDGNEIEPAVPITVTFVSDLIDTADDAHVVHIDDAGRAEVVDSLGADELKSREIADQADELVFESDAFSTYVVAVTTLHKELAASDGATYDITVDAPAEAGIPQDAELRVSEIARGTAGYEDYLFQALQALGEDASANGEASARFFDIKIYSGEVEIQPQAPVRVSIQLADAAPKGTTASAVHFQHSSEERPEVLDATQVGDATTFDATGFSVYGVIYTVDFHWDVDGQTYDFSINGGDALSLRELLVMLGVVEAEDAEAFVAQVADVTFSDPELVAVAKVDEDTTAVALKAKLELRPEYSTELTKDELDAMDAKELAAGDWALISLKAFDTTETLTIKMANGDTLTIKVTDAQLHASVLTADGEAWHITITYDDSAMIPDGSVLVAKEIAEGTSEYEKYLQETTGQWEAADRDGFISLARFFDLEIQKDGKKIEPEVPVEVEIEHEDGFTHGNDESLSVIHFADNGTEIIDELHRNESGTEIVYEQDSFSVIGTVSTVKDSGWPTANGQYVLVLQDGDDYYALKQDGTLQKVRYFNNTVSFIGEGTTTTDYINDYLWYVVSSGNRGKISDEYTEYNATPTGQIFIDPYAANMMSGTSRQLQISDGKIYCSGQLPGSQAYTQVTLSASGGQLSRVALTSSDASPAFFAAAETFSANGNETDLFTQEEVEAIIKKWMDQKTQEATYDKTAEVYDYENRIYQVDIAASSADYEVSPSVALEFVVDASRSMFFPTKIEQCGTLTGNSNTAVKDWLEQNGDINKTYFVVNNPNSDATQIALFYNPYETKHWYNQGGWKYYEGEPYGVWEWTDASKYNPPDGNIEIGNVLDRWSYSNLDLKVYETDMLSSPQYEQNYGNRGTYMSRIEYLKQCVRVASQVIYAVDENAQIGLIGFNRNVTDYGTFGKDKQDTLFEKIDNISLDGGTNHLAGLQKAIEKYNDPKYEQNYANRKHVVVLVTDGAPNAGADVNWTTIGDVATTLKNLEDDFGNKTELYTMGLSLSNVGTNQEGLFGISSGDGYKYSAEDAAQIINAVTKMVDGIFVQANLVADVTDVIDPAFYPVNKSDGCPLAENDWINLSGTKVDAGANDAAGQVKKDATTGNWYVEWKNQSIDWPTTDSHGGVTAPGWHGTIFVKAKEDFLGGNGISTNAAGSQLEATKYKVRGETTEHPMPEGDHTAIFETPYVNIDELDITKNDTEWTVYLGTNVDPLKELKALWEQVNVKEVVTKTDTDHRMSIDGQLTYQYASNTSDNRTEVNGREEFPISELGITLTGVDWADLIEGQPKIFNYDAYGHTKVGTIMVSLTQEVKEGEKDLLESPHDTTRTGNEVEKYTLTVSYRPAGANISDWHTGSYGSGMSGTRAGNILKYNTHIINVYVKGLQITKVDLDDRVLPGAKFALYRTARTDETPTMEIDDKQYVKVADLDTSVNGVAVKDPIDQLNEGEQYYLVETQTPDGYNTIPPIPVTLSLTDSYTPKPGTETQTTKPDSGIYDWVQSALLTLDATSGVKQTDKDGKDISHSGAAAANTITEIVYYRITNNPGVELPEAGGTGTFVYTLCGLALFAAAGYVGIASRRKESEDAA